MGYFIMQRGVSGGLFSPEKMKRVSMCQRFFFGAIAVVFSFVFTATSAQAKVDCQRMIDFAMGELGRNTNSHDPSQAWWEWNNPPACTDKTSYCERFTRESFEAGRGDTSQPNPTDTAYYGLAGYDTACEHWEYIKSRGDVRTDFENMKPGDILYWGDPGCPDAGHVGIFIGDYKGEPNQYISATSWAAELGNCNKPGGVIIHGVNDVKPQGYQSMQCDGIILPPETTGGMCLMPQDDGDTGDPNQDGTLPPPSEKNPCPAGTARHPSLQKAMDYAQQYIGYNYAFGGGWGHGPSRDNNKFGCRNCATAGYKDYRTDPACVHDAPFCDPNRPSFDCSGFVKNICMQFPEFTGKINGATKQYKTNTQPADPDTAPIYLAFTSFGSGGPGTVGHVFINICGTWYNSANYSVGIVNAPSRPSGDSPGIAYRVPKGLEHYTLDDCTCKPITGGGP